MWFREGTTEQGLLGAHSPRTSVFHLDCLQQFPAAVCTSFWSSLCDVFLPHIVIVSRNCALSASGLAQPFRGTVVKQWGRNALQVPHEPGWSVLELPFGLCDWSSFTYKLRCWEREGGGILHTWAPSSTGVVHTWSCKLPGPTVYMRAKGS